MDKTSESITEKMSNRIKKRNCFYYGTIFLTRCKTSTSVTLDKSAKKYEKTYGKSFKQ